MKDRRIDKRPLCFCAAGYKGGACGGWYGREWIMCSGANNLQTCCSEDRYCMWMWVGWRTKSALVIRLRAIFPLVQVTCWPWMSESAFGFVTYLQSVVLATHTFTNPLKTTVRVQCKHMTSWQCTLPNYAKEDITDYAVMQRQLWKTTTHSLLIQKHCN